MFKTKQEHESIKEHAFVTLKPICRKKGEGSYLYEFYHYRKTSI